MAAVTVWDKERFTNWWKDSKEGRRSVDDVRSGRPSTVKCIEVKDQIDKRIRDNRGVSTDETASETNITHVKKRCRNGLRLNRSCYILTETGGF
jgi:hypothetical protein